MDNITDVVGGIPKLQDIDLSALSFLGISGATWTVIIAALMTVAFVIIGYKNGIVTELSSLLGLISAFFVIHFFSAAIKDIVPLKYGLIPRALAFLVVSIIVYHVVKYLSGSLGKVLRKLPIIGFLSGVLGALAGCVKSLLLMILVQEVSGINIIAAIEAALIKVKFLT